MGSKSEAPPAPDYTAQILASQQAAASDAHAADLAFDLGGRQLEQQQRLADQSGARADQFFQMAKDADQWSKDQFNLVWPYAKDYLGSQSKISELAIENAGESVKAAQENRRQATETYDRYMTIFAPREEAFARTADAYASPARQEQKAAEARADVTTAYTQQAQAREAELRSYNIDPSEVRYQGETALRRLSQAGATAAAGTQARTATELAGIGLQGQAVEIGQKLPSQAIAQIAAASQGATSGITAGATGGGGIGAATNLYGQGATPRGVGYGGYANPYTSLSGMSGSVGANLYGSGVSALGAQNNAILAGTGAINSGFQNSLASFSAQQQADQASSAGWGKLIGGIGSLALAPVTGGGSLIGNLLTSSDRRLKEDIKKVGRVGKLTLYTFKYKGDEERRMGYMADDVEKVDPEAVFMMPSGFKAVDYGRATVSALGG